LEDKSGQNRAPTHELEARFLAALPQIEEAIALVSRRNRLTQSERDDFASEVKLAFIEQDYRILERFQGRSSLRTYLVTVINRLFLDHRRRLWGKWHPSAVAVRLGPLAMRLEALIHRDGYSVDEACEIVKNRGGLSESVDELRSLAVSLPPRQRVRLQPLSQDSGDHAAEIHDGGASDPQRALEASETAKRCQEAIARALEALPPDDRIVLRLRFEDGMAVADIARGFKLDQKGLYRRLERLLDELRRALEGAGIRWDDVRSMIDRGQCDLRLAQASGRGSAETSPVRPSNIEAVS
jgi:RNA polymerase sigma factor (sigma-70 family)